MRHSIGETETETQTNQGTEFTAVIYPSQNNLTWNIVIEQWVVHTFDGVTIYPQRQVYQRRIANTGTDGIVGHLEGLGWTVPPVNEWHTVFHNAVQSAYTVELAERPALPEVYRNRVPEERWAISECLLRGIPAEFTAELIDTGARTVEEIKVAFDTEAIMRTVQL